MAVERLGAGGLFWTHRDDNWDLDIAVRSTFDSAVEHNSSSNESKACEISGLREASVLERSSVPYLCLASFGRSVWTSLNQVRTIMFSRLGSILRQC